MENKIKIETKPEDRKTMPKIMYVLILIFIAFVIRVYHENNPAKFGKMYMYSTDFKESTEAGIGFHCVVNVNSDTDWVLDMGADGNNPSIKIKKIDCENAKLEYEAEGRMDIVKVYEDYEKRVARSGFTITNQRDIDEFMNRVSIYGSTIGYVPVMVGIEDVEESGN